MDILAAARQIRLLAMDIDGTLTDGRIWIGHDGEMAKSFSVRDGFGITLLKKAGIQLVIITGRRSAIVERRAAELGITQVHQGVSNKLDTLKAISAAQGMGLDEIAFMGDDWPDLAAMQACALPAAPSDAVPEVLAVARWVATARAGEGALREFANFLLTSRGEFDALLSHYRGGRTHTV
ncbi:MAG: HAD hydrolase family protein [Lautropia sp.]|nr:HAD hydrolase family protein [Lautropia sp.]